MKMGMTCKSLKGELFCVTDKQLCIINNIIIKTVIPPTKELKNKAVLSLRQYYMHCYVVLI